MLEARASDQQPHKRCSRGGWAISTEFGEIQRWIGLKHSPQDHEIAATSRSLHHSPRNFSRIGMLRTRALISITIDATSAKFIFDRQHSGNSISHASRGRDDGGADRFHGSHDRGGER
ncbi:hypothetical protein EJB05_56501, partial [Eragrostis curvula]